MNKWEQKQYRSGLGQLNWLAQNTRPDLSYMVSHLGRNMEQEIYADASFGNVEGGKTQIGYYIGLRDKECNTCQIIWKSRVAKKSSKSTSAVETFSVAEAVEWGEYIKHIRDKLNNSDVKRV